MHLRGTGRNGNQKVFPERKLVTYWPEHGFAPGGVPAKISFTIYRVDPLLSFTVYGGKPAALCFFDEKQTLERIGNTVQSAPHGKYVDVNRILLDPEKPKAETEERPKEKLAGCRHYCTASREIAESGRFLPAEREASGSR